MEKFDLYTKDRVLLNKTLKRGLKLPKGTYRLVVHLAVVYKNKMLIQKRSLDKKNWPGLWDITCGGSVISGETSSMAIQREFNEELGINYDFSNTLPFCTTYFKEGFDDLYVVEKKINLKDIKIQLEEVCEVKWATKTEIKKMIKSGEFVQYHLTYIDYIFEKRSKLDEPLYRNKIVM